MLLLGNVYLNVVSYPQILCNRLPDRVPETCGAHESLGVYCRRVDNVAGSERSSVYGSEMVSAKVFLWNV